MRRRLVLVAVIVLLLYAVVPQLSFFHASWHLLSHPRFSWIVLAITFAGLTYIFAALTYCLLALKPLPYWTTVLVQLAAMFINRLLPGGVGALGVNYAYLRRKRFDAGQATSMVAINNLAGVVGHGLLVAVVLLFAADQDQRLSPRFGQPLYLLIIFALVLIVVIGAVLIFGRRRFNAFMRSIRTQLLGYQDHPERLIAGLLSSILLTTCNVACLACAVLALGVHLPFVAVLLIFTFGIGAGTVTPTPGGLGGFEAGLVAGLVAYRVANAEALAIALLYRLISYWLALAIGGAAFVVAQRRQLFSS